MPQLDPIPVASLLIDTENPRFLDSIAGQREALRESAEHQQGKLLALAEDVVNYGLSPIEITMVMRKSGKEARYIVLEGNRRLVALPQDRYEGKEVMFLSRGLEAPKVTKLLTDRMRVIYAQSRLRLAA
jgi:hypothetical protein